jgi:hypothetical protein
MSESAPLPAGTQVCAELAEHPETMCPAIHSTLAVHRAVRTVDADTPHDGLHAGIGFPAP